MDKHAPFCAFIDAVCAQVRFTPARAKIAEELTVHLEDRAEMLAARGVPLAENGLRGVRPQVHLAGERREAGV